MDILGINNPYTKNSQEYSQISLNPLEIVFITAATKKKGDQLSNIPYCFVNSTS